MRKNKKKTKKLKTYLFVGKKKQKKIKKGMNTYILGIVKYQSESI